MYRTKKIFVDSMAPEVSDSFNDDFNNTDHLAAVAVAADTLYFTGGYYTFRRGDTDSKRI